MNFFGLHFFIILRFQNTTMKNINLILNVILSIAVIILFVLHFSSKSPQKSGKEEVKNKEVINTSAGDFSVAYVNWDTLSKNYKLYTELKDLLQANQQKDEATLMSRQNELEKKAMELREKMEKYLVTQTQAEAMQKQLMQEQQRLMEMRDKMGMNLAQAQESMNTTLFDSISSYLKDFNKEHNFRFIFGNTGNFLLYSDHSLDITENVINGLNTRYVGKKEEVKK